MGTFAAVVVLVAAACSGDDDASDATTTPTTVPATTTAAPSSTTSSPSTTVAETTMPESTVESAPTSAPPTTTLAPDGTTTTTVADPEVQAVIDGLFESWTAFNEIKLDPFNDEKLRAVAETHRGALLERVVGIVETLRVEGKRSVPNPEAPTELVPFADTVVISGSTARIDYCWVNSNILVETGGNPDGTDRVIDDGVTAVIQRDTFELVDDRWLALDSEAVDRFPEVASCDAVL